MRFSFRRSKTPSVESPASRKRRSRDDDLANRDLSGREQWTGIVLTPEEKALVLSRVDDCAQEAAAKIAVKLPKKEEKDGDDE